jgi:hypothetical protein
LRGLVVEAGEQFVHLGCAEGLHEPFTALDISTSPQKYKV